MGGRSAMGNGRWAMGGWGENADRISAHVVAGVRARRAGGRCSVGLATGSPSDTPRDCWRRGRDDGRLGSGPESRGGGDRRPRHHRSGHAGGDRRPLCAAGDHRCGRPRRAARPDQHAHSRADGPLPGSGRRPGVDGVAPEVHFSQPRRRRSARSSSGPVHVSRSSK